MILSCKRCADSTSKGAQFQSALYGPGKRVHNETVARLGSERVFRCTICEAERTKKGS